MALPPSLLATVADFEVAFTTMEAIELSNKEDASATTVVDSVIQKALDDAEKFITGYDDIALPGAKVLIRRSVNRFMLVIARFYLDTLKRREDVKLEFNEVKDFLQNANELAKLSAKPSKATLAELGIIDAPDVSPYANGGTRTLGRIANRYRRDRFAL